MSNEIKQLGPFRFEQQVDGTWQVEHVERRVASGADMRDALQNFMHWYPELRLQFHVWGQQHVDEFNTYFGPRSDEEALQDFRNFVAAMGGIV